MHSSAHGSRNSEYFVGSVWKYVLYSRQQHTTCRHSVLPLPLASCTAGPHAGLLIHSLFACSCILRIIIAANMGYWLDSVGSLQARLHGKFGGPYLVMTAVSCATISAARQLLQIVNPAHQACVQQQYKGALACILGCILKSGCRAMLHYNACQMSETPQACICAEGET